MMILRMLICNIFMYIVHCEDFNSIQNPFTGLASGPYNPLGGKLFFHINNNVKTPGSSARLNYYLLVIIKTC